MRVPQVSERIKEAPAHALRGVFAGIGQLLLITDKLRNKASHQDVPHARTRLADEVARFGLFESPEAAVGAVVGLTPSARLASTEDIANAVLFLASDNAAFVNGVGLPVDGGMGM